ncbi:MAG: ATP-binding cassette domain-containing protein [Firmicutes bacterium]|nr:ATP-binding cassette domain-containing protein [Bacillota bacterium]
MSNIIEVNHLVKKFGQFEAVKGISLTVQEGEIFGLLGPNGAGKSTTIKILSTLLKPTAGIARLAGYDIATQPALVRQAIGLVFQDPSLDESLTARENLIFHAILYGVPKVERERRLAEVLAMVELADRSKELVKTFSGGMKRRLEIARGLLHYPRVLFLDEPTVGLDPQTRNHIWQYIHQLRSRENITIFMTTHYMDEAENCDRIAIIDHGQIVALDTPTNLKKLVGGDIISMRTDDNARAMAFMQEKYGLKLSRDRDGIHFEINNGEEFIPKVVAELPLTVNYISLRKPTLDDVFLQLTGRDIREEEVGAKDIMRAHVRMRRRRQG